MGFRFQKRIGIGSFGRINISKSGVSLTKGVRGAHITLGKTPRITLGLPGSGLSWTQTLGGRGRRAAQAVSQPLPRWVVLTIIVGLALLAIFGGH